MFPTVVGSCNFHILIQREQKLISPSYGRSRPQIKVITKSEIFLLSVGTKSMRHGSIKYLNKCKSYL